MKASSLFIILFIGLFVLGSAQAQPTNLKVKLSGQKELPPVETQTNGWAMFRFNKNHTLMTITLVVKQGIGLLGANGAYLYCGLADEVGPIIATLAGEVPGGVEGRLSVRESMTDANITPTDCGATLDELLTAMTDGMVYVNVHSIDYSEGEVRGQIKGNRGKGKPPK